MCWRYITTRGLQNEIENWKSFIVLFNTVFTLTEICWIIGNEDVECVHVGSVHVVPELQAWICVVETIHGYHWTDDPGHRILLLWRYINVDIMAWKTKVEEIFREFEVKALHVWIGGWYVRMGCSFTTARLSIKYILFLWSMGCSITAARLDKEYMYHFSWWSAGCSITAARLGKEYIIFCDLRAAALLQPGWA